MEAQCAPIEAISNISFCNVCGDSLLAVTCSSRNPPPECLHVAPENADAKRKDADGLSATYDVFKARMMAGEKNRKDILADHGKVFRVLEVAHWGSREQGWVKGR